MADTIADRMAKANQDRRSAAISVTEADILAAMDPNGATIKLCEIVAELSNRTGYSEYALYSNVQNKLRRMRKAGSVELTKGAGSGWRIIGRKVSP
jgi:lambda repressor-like predicted transcriptional regulator